MMTDRDQRLSTMRRLFGAGSAALYGWAAVIWWTGQITIHGKHGPPITYHGGAALSWAALTACMATGLLGVFFAKAWQVGSWLGLWIIAGVAIVLLPALLPA